MTPLSEQEIIQLCKKETTREKGFDVLMKTYGKQLYWHIRRTVVSEQDAEDVLQETFINIFKYIGDFKNECKLSSWLYKIATHECIKLFRKNKIKYHWIDDGGSEWLSEKLIEENKWTAQQILLKLHHAILQLPEKQRTVFNLRYFDDLSYEAISTITNTSVSSLKTNYHYAFEKIKKIMNDE
jgi:RNA polymerase sigma-70 factor (ECF subfamily)